MERCMTKKSEHELIRSAKRRAKRLRGKYPDICHMHRLDVVAREMGYQNFRSMQRELANEDIA
jgi:aryl-alcohol dehydrogenase-like predicted oxidoreductase